jgi:hypothetical protein
MKGKGELLTLIENDIPPGIEPEQLFAMKYGRAPIAGHDLIVLIHEERGPALPSNNSYSISQQGMPGAPLPDPMSSLSDLEPERVDP